LPDAEDSGVKGLPEVEAERGGHVQVRVHMVDVVKPPQQGIDVVGPVPVVKGGVHPQKTQNELEPEGEGQPVKKAEGLRLGPGRGGQGRGSDQGDAHSEGERGYCQIHGPAPRPGPLGPPQGPQGLQDHQQHEENRQRLRGPGREGKGMGHLKHHFRFSVFGGNQSKRQVIR